MLPLGLAKTKRAEFSFEISSFQKQSPSLILEVCLYRMLMARNQGHDYSTCLLQLLVCISMHDALQYDFHSKGPYRPNAIRQRDANFQFLKSNKTVNG